MGDGVISDFALHMKALAEVVAVNLAAVLFTGVQQMTTMVVHVFGHLLKGKCGNSPKLRSLN